MIQSEVNNFPDDLCLPKPLDQTLDAYFSLTGNTEDGVQVKQHLGEIKFRMWDIH